MARIKLSKKQQAEYDILKKRFRISLKEYKEYYDEVRKANKKLTQLNRKGKLLVPRSKYTTKVEGIKTKQQFKSRLTNIKKVLKRDFRQNVNFNARKNFVKSIYQVYRNSLTQKEMKELITLVNEMSDTQLLDFIDNNPELYKYFQSYVEFAVKQNIAEYGEIDKSAIFSRLKYSRDNYWGTVSRINDKQKISDEMISAMIDEVVRQM